MDRKETPIVSSFLGIIKNGTCPVCGAALAPGFDAPALLLCPDCGEYSEVAEKKLRQMDTARVLPQPSFTAPTPWADMHAPTFQTISFATSVEDYLKETLTDLALTKEHGLRVLDANGLRNAAYAEHRQRGRRRRSENSLLYRLASCG